MADVACTSTENNEAKTDNPDMPPPCVSSKPHEKTEKRDEGSKEKTSTKEKNETVPELPYKVPSWSGIPEELYSLEVLKNGCIISNIDLTSKPFHLFGRLPNCDVSLEHPSVSRYHAVIQYKSSDSSNSEKGFYIYDLGSTHGTTVNKLRLEPKRYYRLRVGYVFKFGGSSRLFILQGPEDIEESGEDNTTTEQAAPRSKSEVGQVMTEEEYEEWKKEREGGKQDDQDTGIDWGMGEDAVEEPVYPPDFGDVNREAEQHHFKDPKKTLRGFFEREGLELEYDVEEKGPGHARVYHCKVKLPIDGPSGDPIYAEAAVTGRKKEAVLECALEACRMLDAAGLLRQSSHESRKHKEKNWEENDFYDSDEDSFLDRTGSVEKKRIQRMKRAGKDKPTMETFESLTSKLEALDSEIQGYENKLKQDVAGNRDANSDGADSLDDYMSSLGTSVDKATRTQIRRKVFELKKERQRLVRLLNIAKPTSLPPVTEPVSAEIDANIDEVSLNSETKSKASDSSEVTTVDKDTGTRHQSADDYLETPADVSNKNSTNLPERKQEFVVPLLSALPKRKNKTHSKAAVEQPLEEKETENIKNAERSEQLDNERQQGRKRVGSDDADQEQNEKTEGNNTGSPKKKKKRSYHVPSQWEAVSDPTFAAWMPPEGQTGDGRTHLNEKFGY